MAWRRLSAPQTCSPVLAFVRVSIGGGLMGRAGMEAVEDWEEEDEDRWGVKDWSVRKGERTLVDALLGEMFGRRKEDMGEGRKTRPSLIST